MIYLRKNERNIIIQLSLVDMEQKISLAVIFTVVTLISAVD